MPVYVTNSSFFTETEGRQGSEKKHKAIQQPTNLQLRFMVNLDFPKRHRCNTL